MRCAVIAVLLAAGCASGEASLPRPTPPLAFVDPADRHPEAPLVPSGARDPDRDDPMSVAMAGVASGLTDQSLVVLDIDGHVFDVTDDHATVRVTAIHAGGRGHPHQSAYNVELERVEGAWRVVGFNERM